jgi:hypothetical protein
MLMKDASALTARYVVKAEFRAVAVFSTFDVPQDAEDAFRDVTMGGASTTLLYTVEAASLPDAQREGLRLAEVYARTMNLPREPAVMSVRKGKAEPLLLGSGRGNPDPMV